MKRTSKGDGVGHQQNIMDMFKRQKTKQINSATAPESTPQMAQLQAEDIPPEQTVVQTNNLEDRPTQVVATETELGVRNANDEEEVEEDNIAGPASTLSKLQPQDLSKIDEQPKQPFLTLFPYTTFSEKGKPKKRNFNCSWYKNKWVEYSISVDSVFCKFCRHFGCGSGTFVAHGYNNWKRLCDSLPKHAESEGHKIAESKYLAWKSTNATGTVLDQLDPVYANGNILERNRDHIKVALDVLLFCAMQDLPLRGHREISEAVNRGNFLELFYFLSKYNPEIKKRMDELPANAKMLSPEIQNDLLEASASLLLRKIKDEVQQADYFSILADEAKDCSKKELVAVFIRYVYVHNNNQLKLNLLKERCVGFREIHDMSADTIAESILQILGQFQLDPEKCVGFAFDGASVMSGEKNGVQAKLQEHFKNATYFHCNSHRLNLVLCEAAHSERMVSDFFETVNDIYSFMTGSKRHATFLEVQRKMRPNKQLLELERGSDTRWSSRSRAVDKILTLQGVILEVLSMFYQGDKDKETRNAALLLLTHMQTKKFQFLLTMFAKLFEVTNYATIGLQSSSLSVDKVVDLVETMKASLSELRRNDQKGFRQILALANHLQEKHDITELDVRCPRKPKLPGCFKDFVITTTTGGSTSRVKSDDDLQHVWYNVLDRMISECDRRFREDAYGIMKCAAACIPTSSDFMNTTHIFPVVGKYNLDVTSSETDIFKRYINRRMSTTTTTTNKQIYNSNSEDEANAAGEHDSADNEVKVVYSSLMEVLDDTDRDIFPGIHKMLLLLLAIPSTSCSVERLFSCVKRVKTRLRSSMTTTRLNNLTLLSFEREATTKLNKDEIIDIFKTLSNRRLRI